MLNISKFIEILISLQVIIISTFIPAFISLPSINKVYSTFELPITWQVPSIIVITLIFKGEIVIKAFSIYLIIGLFYIPLFYQGGSLGYLLTPNFGYLLGIYSLIKIIDNLNKKDLVINYLELLKYGIIGITSMHLIGIIYIVIQLLYFKQLDDLFYTVAKYSFGKFGYHLLMLTPIIFLIKLINKIRYQNNV